MLPWNCLFRSWSHVTFWSNCHGYHSNLFRIFSLQHSSQFLANHSVSSFKLLHLKLTQVKDHMSFISQIKSFISINVHDILQILQRKKQGFKDLVNQLDLRIKLLNIGQFKLFSLISCRIQHSVKAAITSVPGGGPNHTQQVSVLSIGMDSDHSAFIHSFLHSFIPPLIHSFIHSWGLYPSKIYNGKSYRRISSKGWKHFLIQLTLSVPRCLMAKPF